MQPSVPTNDSLFPDNTKKNEQSEDEKLCSAHTANGKASEAWVAMSRLKWMYFRSPTHSQAHEAEEKNPFEFPHIKGAVLERFWIKNSLWKVTHGCHSSLHCKFKRWAWKFQIIFARINRKFVNYVKWIEETFALEPPGRRNFDENFR